MLRGLRFLMTVGEPVTGTDVTAARPHLGPTTTFWNGFGSSEMGCVAYCPVEPEAAVPDGVVPAGWPLSGKTVRVVREDGSTADPGETGELVVLSDGMTSGYWGAPEKTAEHLVPATGAGTPDTPDGCPVPAWRQGDLARLDPDGRLVLLGRSDDAVKVRGYLVEPSEVEAALRALPEVQDAVVTALVAPPAVTRLVAYVVGRQGRRTPSPAAIRRALREGLPEYMVPASIVPMTELPRNERGKVDRAELPGAPSIESEMTEREYDQWELVVGQIWAEVLGLAGVHLDEDFSALGGDSLTAEEMLAIVHERLGVDLRGSDVLEHPTLRAFARRVRAGTHALPSHPDVVKVSGAREPGGPPVFCFAGAGRSP
ncbi:non-ribosomal peptide synthetase [Curtobacterium flaccumfaciens]|nr:non-ribosomal peptide synthetase [Curtobacterium flaccumfaciens]